MNDAYNHLKVIGYNSAALPLLDDVGIGEDDDEGIVELGAAARRKQFIEAAKKQRIWEREPPA